MSVDLSSIKSTSSPAPKNSVEGVMKAIPAGSLVRVRWVERLDAEEWDQGISIENSDDPVVVVEWQPEYSFVDVNDLVAVEFTCLWKGELFRTTSYCIFEVLSREATDV